MRPPGLGKVAQLPHVFSEDDASQGLLLRLGSGPGPVDDPNNAGAKVGNT